MMPAHCSAYNCRNRRCAATFERGISFHSFPKNEETRRKWAEAVRRCNADGSLWQPNQRDVLCSDHFTEDDIDRTGNTARLRPDSFPSVFDFQQINPTIPKTKSTGRDAEDDLRPSPSTLDSSIAMKMAKWGLIGTIQNNWSYCSAKNCNNRTTKQGLHFFKFPKDEERCKQWITNSQREDLLKKNISDLNKSCKLCSNHFEDNQFMSATHNSLVWNAVPTKFVNTKSLATRKRKMVLHNSQENNQEILIDTGKKRNRKVKANSTSKHNTRKKPASKSLKSTTLGTANDMEGLVKSPVSGTGRPKRPLKSRLSDVKIEPEESPPMKKRMTSTSSLLHRQKQESVQELLRDVSQLLLQEENESCSDDDSSLANEEPLEPFIVVKEEPDRMPVVMRKDDPPVFIKQEPIDDDTPLIGRKENDPLLTSQENNCHSLLAREKVSPLPLKLKENSSRLAKDIKNKTTGTNSTENNVDQQDRITSLPNDFIRIEFAKPKKQVVFKLMKKTDTPIFKCNNLYDLLNSLKERNLLRSEIEELLYTFGIVPKGLRRIGAEASEKVREFNGYPEDVKSFATLLLINSQKTYDIVNTYFMLPEKTLLRARLQVTGFWPGFTREALKRMKEQVSGIDGDGMCSIMFDSVTLKKRHQLDKASNKWLGYVDFGGGQMPIDADEIPLASEVALFTAVGLRTSWKIPFGYFMHKGISGELLKNLVNEAILLLEENGLNVRAVVCNGSGLTVKMAKLFGCGIHAKKWIDIMPSFPHPSKENHRIYFVFGIKKNIHRLENLFREKEILHNSAYGSIKWKFINKLIGDRGCKTIPECVLLESLKHLEFYQLQRISRCCSSIFNMTVCEALNTARALGIDGYSGSKGTSLFVADVHRALCLLEARNPSSSEDRPPISQMTLREQIESATLVVDRLLGLEYLSGQLVLDESRWMSVVLFAFTLKSVALLGSELVNDAALASEKGFQQFYTYCLNMDHSDMVLCSLQRHGGWDDVPTPLEFRNAYKNLFKQLNKKNSSNNYFDGEDLTIAQGEIYKYRNFRVRNRRYFKYPVFTDLEMDSLHLAKYVIQQVSQRLTCPDCVSILIDDNCENYVKAERVFSNLIKPSRFISRLLKICKNTLKKKSVESNMMHSEQLVLFVNCDYFALHESWDLPEIHSHHLSNQPYHIIGLVKTVIRIFISTAFCKRKEF